MKRYWCGECHKQFETDVVDYYVVDYYYASYFQDVLCPYCDFATNNFSYVGEFRNRDLYHAKPMREK